MVIRDRKSKDPVIKNLFYLAPIHMQKGGCVLFRNIRCFFEK